MARDITNVSAFSVDSDPHHEIDLEKDVGNSAGTLGEQIDGSIDGISDGCVE